MSYKDQEFYKPFFRPWLAPGPWKEYIDISVGDGCLNRERLYVLFTLLKSSLQLCGDIIECGTYRGGSASLIAAYLNDIVSIKKLMLFDTFKGMPECNPKVDMYKKGQFGKTSVDFVADRLFDIAPYANVEFYPGLIPETFNGLGNKKFCFAHIDVDIYQAHVDSLEFIYPRMSSSSIILFDDYGSCGCPSARKAIDEFFENKPEQPIFLMTGQGLVVKH